MNGLTSRSCRLTGEPRFRQGMVLAAQMGLGANRNNVVDEHTPHGSTGQAAYLWGSLVFE